LNFMLVALRAKAVNGRDVFDFQAELFQRRDLQLAF
jgi:hypothetical protein